MGGINLCPFMKTEAKKPSRAAYKSARKEQEAREKGRSIRHYARKVTEQLVTPGESGALTPSKKARRNRN